MQMVILAGGTAPRLKPLSEVTPGPLVSVEGRPFLAYQLDLLRANGIERIVLCVGHLAHKVKSYFRDGSSFGVEIRYSEDGPRPLGSAGALRKARPLLDEVFFVMYGDTYVVVQYPKVWSYFHRFDRQGLLLVKPGEAPGQAPCTAREGLVVEYGSAPPGRRFIDAGVSILRKRALALVPARRRVDLATLFARLARQRQLLALRTDSDTHAIDSRDGLSEFRRYIAAMSA